MQNISPIKQRILQYIDTHCSSKREFYAKTGISRGTLESKTGISEETFTKIFATYQILSPIWVLTGKGDMLISEDKADLIQKEYSVCPACKEKDERIAELKDHISTLKDKISSLDKTSGASNRNYSQTA